MVGLGAGGEPDPGAAHAARGIDVPEHADHRDGRTEGDCVHGLGAFESGSRGAEHARVRMMEGSPEAVRFSSVDHVYVSHAYGQYTS